MLLVLLLLIGFTDPTLIINGTNGLISKIDTGRTPSGVAVNPNTHKIYVTNWALDTVTIINLSKSRGIRSELPGPGIKFSNSSRYNVKLAVNPNTHRIYMIYGTPHNNATLTVIDSLHDKVLIDKQNLYGVIPSQIAIQPKTNMVYAIMEPCTVNAMNGSMLLKHIDISPNYFGCSIAVDKQGECIFIYV